MFVQFDFSLNALQLLNYVAQYSTNPGPPYHVSP